MTPESFVYWLNGFVELENPVAITEAQWKSIKEHLALAMKKVTPQVVTVVNNPLVKNPADIDWSKYFPPNQTLPLQPYQPHQPMWLGNNTPIC